MSDIRLLISTGEVSGDLQGSLLIQGLKREAKRRSLSIEIFALGGPRMNLEGANLIADTAPLGAIGLWEALPLVIPTLRVQSKLDKALRSSPPDVVILIDYMGANIRLGNKLRKELPNVPIVYYIAPQEWAWRLGDGGTTDLISFTNKILAIFQEEADFYKKKGGNVSWVGHPMIDTFTSLPSRSEALNKLGLDSNQKLLLLLPASRKQELRYIMPVLSDAAKTLQNNDPNIQVLVPAGLEKFEIPLQKALDEAGVVGRIISSNDFNKLRPFLFAAADLALSKSGTVNMELALNGVPQVVGYKVSRVTAFIARNILNFKVDHISPVNLLLRERLVPELVQDEFNPESIVNMANRLLYDANQRSGMLEGYSRLRSHLGAPGVTDRAAKEILNLIKK